MAEQYYIEKEEARLREIKKAKQEEIKRKEELRKASNDNKSIPSYYNPYSVNSVDYDGLFKVLGFTAEIIMHLIRGR